MNAYHPVILFNIYQEKISDNPLDPVIRVPFIF
jgi:hypothetical protein